MKVFVFSVSICKNFDLIFVTESGNTKLSHLVWDCIGFSYQRMKYLFYSWLSNPPRYSSTMTVDGISLSVCVCVCVCECERESE